MKKLIFTVIVALALVAPVFACPAGTVMHCNHLGVCWCERGG
jgi:hypothetical protein